MSLAERSELPLVAISSESTRSSKTGTWRYISPVPQALLAPCRAACPIGNDIPRFIGALAEGRGSDALEALRDETPFPGICGRICHRFCQALCNRKHLDRAISIAALERAAAWGGSSGSAPPARSPSGRGRAESGWPPPDRAAGES